ncbi:MAG: cytochrome P450 [Chloroflexota bacterium]
MTSDPARSDGSAQPGPTTEDWDPRDPSVLADQRRAYDEMRERCPVASSEFMGWSLFRWSDVSAVLADPATFSNASRHPAIPNGMDPPMHARYRAALEPCFSESAMRQVEGRCREIAAELVDSMLAADDPELLRDFAEPLALRGLCAFLGWPEGEWEALGGWTHGNQQAALTRDRSAGRALAILLTEHVTRNLEGHRAHGPDEDLTDVLLALRIDGRALADEEVAAALRNWIAGEGTVAGGISVVVLQLAQQPELQALLRREPSRIPGAIEEMLRVDDPLVANRRTASRPVDLGGRHVEAGQTVSLMWVAANRDPEAFADPAIVRLDRDLANSLVWGQGIHVCMGAALARLQIRVGLEELLRRTTSFEVGGPVRRSVYPSDALAEFAIGLVPSTGGSRADGSEDR